jgi:hypothetical protein
LFKKTVNLLEFSLNERCLDINNGLLNAVVFKGGNVKIGKILAERLVASKDGSSALRDGNGRAGLELLEILDLGRVKVDSQTQNTPHARQRQVEDQS